ncbi:Retrovirus-related Pol polyprotein from transposon RE1-like protein [Drosera capensis]
MEQSKGFECVHHPEYACKLKKALYGLNQATRARYNKIAEFFLQCGYSITPADSNLFIKNTNGKISMVLVYVDDIIITGNDEEEIKRRRRNLSVKFQMNELGELKHFLGLEIYRI